MAELSGSAEILLSEDSVREWRGIKALLHARDRWSRSCRLRVAASPLGVFVVLHLIFPESFQGLIWEDPSPSCFITERSGEAVLLPAEGSDWKLLFWFIFS